MKQEDINKELAELAPFLKSISKDADRSVPDGYFEDLPNATWNKILESKKPESNNVRSIFYKSLAVAASFAFLFFVFKGINNTNQVAEEIPMDIVVDFILDDIEDMDEGFLFDLHTSSLELVELEDENIEYILDQGIDEVDDQFLETLY